MCAASPDAAFARTPGAEYVFARLPIPFFNLAILTSDVPNASSLRDHGREACAWAQPHQVPWFLMVTHDTLAPEIDATASLDELELMPLLNLTGMIADEVTPPPVMPEGLAVSVPAADADCRAMLAINEAAYGMDMQSAQPIMGTHAFWKNYVPVVGSADGIPVSCSAVMPIDGYHYVAFVATDPNHRRRGYADAAMRHSLAVAESSFGKAKSFLHATDAGRPVYERMGYRAVSSHTFYIEKKFMEGH